MLPPYTLNPPRRTTKHLRITITRDGHIKVSKPNRVSISQMEKFILSKSDWINQTLEKIKSHPIQPKLTKKDFHIHKSNALAVIAERVKQYNQHYNFTYKNISIKNQKTRWGSCSHRGNLNFNYKIVLLPEKLLDYVVVHELCHLGQFNHSIKFWNLVAETIPDHKEIRGELSKIHL